MDPVLEVCSQNDASLSETDFTKCIICQEETEGAVHKLTLRGIETLKFALTKRQDDVYNRLYSGINDTDALLSKDPFCHRSCKSQYTHKHKIQDTDSIIETCNSEQTNTNNGKRQKINFEKCCFLCEKARDTRGIHQMSIISSDKRQAAIYNRAKELNNESVLLKLMGQVTDHVDMKTNGFRYHKSCMQSFMLTSAAQDVEKNSQVEYDECFKILVEDLTNKLEKTHTPYFLSQIRDWYRQLLAERCVSGAFSYRSDKLRARLQKHFGSRIQIVPQTGTSSLVCSSQLTVQDMCSEILRLKQSTCCDDSELLSECDMTGTNEPLPDRHDISYNSYITATCIRGKMKAKAKEQKTAQERANIEGGDGDVVHEPGIDICHAAASAIIPDELYNHLAWLTTDADFLVDNGTRVSLTEHMHEKVINLSQDVMAASVSMTLPKHVGLGLHIFKQTRSKELLTVMNRVGNTLGYIDAQRYITTEANAIEHQERKDGLFIPAGVNVGRFTQCAFDNLDFSESTTDGKTLHATTHNIYQYGDAHSVSDKDSSHQVPLRKGRSVTIEKRNDFVPRKACLTLKDRREARNLKGVPLVDEESTVHKSSCFEDDTFIWNLTRMVPTTLMSLENLTNTTLQKLSWNNYFDRLHEKSPTTTIAYGPLFPSSPTNPDVVEASLDYFIKLSGKLEQENTVVTCDQAIYDIAKGLQRKKPQRYAGLVLRMGGFHIAENFMGAIGYLMKGSGIDDILTLSNICGTGTARKVMAGKDYYKMVRYHSLVSEAITRLKWNAFEDYLTEEGLADSLSVVSDKVEALVCSLKDNDRNTTRNKVDDTKVALRSLTDSWVEYESTLGTTAQFWSMYLDMIAILHRYIRAERSSSWTDHLTEVQNMIPYIISAGQTKYATCLPLYLQDMRNLPMTAPEVHRQFSIGNFSVHRKCGTFNGIWTDLALEQTYNKDGKTTLLKGITQSAATRDKYLKTIPFLTSISEKVREMCHIATAEATHYGDSKTMDSETEKQVIDIISTIQTNMVDPFNSLQKNDLLNIATGEIARSAEVVLARSKGIDAMKDAEIHERAQIKNPKIVTFATQEGTQRKGNKYITGIYRDEMNVARSLCFVRNSSEEAKLQCFSHEWTDYPTSLFEPNPRITTLGHSMRKGNKSDFLKVLTTSTENHNSNSLPDSMLPTVYLIDGMALIQRIQTYGAHRFGELPSLYLNKILRMKPKESNSVHFIGDRYDIPPDKSLKSDERLRRSQSKQSPQYKPSDNIDIPDWKQFLQNQTNKENLLDYVATSWCECSNQLPDGVSLFLGGTFKDKSMTVKLSNTECIQLPELTCTEHEEADTRIMAHLAYSVGSGYTRAVIYTTDTDITILGMYHISSLTTLNELWMESNDVYIPIHTLVHSLASICQKPLSSTVATLLCCYVITGCDTVSFPYRRGKKKAANVALKMVGDLPHLEQFGRQEHDMVVDDTLIGECRQVFVSLYGRHDFSSLDVLRAHLFAPSNADIRSLPPTEDAFRLHVYRALYQIAIYKRAHLSQLGLPAPEEFGRTVVNGKLTPVMTQKPPRPTVPMATSCKCGKSMCLKMCSCAKASVPCVVSCMCTGESGKCGRVVQNEDDLDQN